MKKSIVAIVGRPNVGKSTLFNRICKKRSAIVDFQEGVTRDRKYETADWNGKYFLLVDTGGIIPKSIDQIDTAVKIQAEIAIEEADVVLFVVDAKVGVTAMDEQITSILSPHRKKVMLVANKTDNEKDLLEIYDFLKLGLGEPYAIAALHGRNMGNFLDDLTSILSDCSEDDTEESIKVAIVGKPNVGKSSLLNRLLGQQSVIVADTPGTTRDSIDASIHYFEKKITFIDTAGLRKKSKVKYGIEYFSTMRTLESVLRADVTLLILDATDEVSNQDQKIASYALRNHKDIIILMNKWDLVKKDNHSVKEFTKKINEQLNFIEHAPVIFISALSGQRVQKVLETVLDVYAESQKRIPTARLNSFLEKVVGYYPPSHSSGKHVRIFFCTQILSHPPTFVFFCNNPKLVTVTYRRYLENKIREEFQFSGAALRLFFRGRTANEFVD
jgi:GTP-binding protein